MLTMRSLILSIITIFISFAYTSCSSNDEPYMEGAGCIRNGKYTNVEVLLDGKSVSSVSEIVVMSNPIEDEPNAFKAILRIKGLEKKGKISYINGVYTYDSFHGSVEINKTEYTVIAEFIGSPTSTLRSDLKIVVHLNSK